MRAPFKLNAIACAIAALIVGCGGGGGGGTSGRADPLPPVGFYGDSLTHGDVPDAAGNWTRLEHPSAARLAEAVPYEVIDYSAGAATVAEAMGLPSVWVNVAPGRLPFKPFAAHILTAREGLCIFRYGVADAGGGEDVERFEELLDEMVMHALHAGKVVMLVSMASEHRWQWPAFDNAIRAIAKRRNVQLIDLTTSAPGVLPDRVHGDQATSDAWTRVIAAAVHP